MQQYWARHRALIEPALPTMTTIVSATLRSLFNRIHENGEIDKESLLSLYFLFRTTLPQALEIVDSSQVTRIVLEGIGRSFFVVEGKNSKYLCFTHYCTCPSFMYSVVSHMETPMVRW